MDDIKAVIWKEGDVFVSVLKGTDISSYGESPNEALDNLKEATELYLEDMSEDEKREISGKSSEDYL